MTRRPSCPVTAALGATALLLATVILSAAPAQAHGGRDGRRPDPRPVLFVHGSAGSAQQYQTQAKRFASIDRRNRLLDDLVDDETGGTFLPLMTSRAAAIRLTLIELSRRAAVQPSPDDRVFISYLVDLVAAVLATPVSAETHRLWNNTVG